MHLYLLPAVRWVTLKGDAAPAFVRVAPPLLDLHLAVYPVIARPLLAPALNDTLREPEATLTALRWVGAPGEPTITAADGEDAGPVPRALVALTVHVYLLAVVRCVTVKGDAAPAFVLVAPPLLDLHLAV